MSHPSGKSDAEKRAEASAAANRTKDVITDLKAGKAPPNEFIVDGIDRAKVTLDERKADPRVTPAGHKFIDDTKEVLDATREFITTKNAGGEIQTMLEGASHEAKMKATEARAKSAARPKDPAAKRAARAKAKANARKMGGFLKLLATDTEFRSLMGDLVNYAGEMFNPGYKDRMRSLDLSSDPRIAVREVKEMHKEEHKRAAASDKVPDSDEVEEKLNAVMIKLSKNPAFLDASRALLGAIRRMYDRVGRTSYGVKYYPETYARTTYTTTTAAPAIRVTSDPVKTTVSVPTASAATTVTTVPVIKPATVVVKEPHSGMAPELSAKGKAAVDAGKRLIENITNDYSLDAIIQAAKDLGKMIKNDPEARRWAKDFYYHLEEMLDRPELFADTTYRNTNMRPLFRRGKDVLKKYEFSREMDIIIAESNNLFTSFKDDKVVSRLQTSLQTLANDLFTRDERGRPHLNESAMEQVRTVIIPLLAEQLKFIGIPRIEIHDESMDAWFDNLAVSFYELLPSQLKVKTASNTKIDLKDLEMRLDGFLKIVLEDIKLNLKDVKFSIDRHKTPKIKSEGTVDIATKGKDGLKIVIRFGIKVPEGKHVPELQAALVDVVYMPGIKIHFHKDADHHGMLNFGTSLAGSTVKNRVKTAIQDKMTEMFNGLRDKLNTIIANSPMVSTGAAKMDAAKSAVKGTDFHKHMVKENEKTSM